MTSEFLKLNWKTKWLCLQSCFSKNISLKSFEISFKKVLLLELQNSFSPGQFLSPFQLSSNCGVIVAWLYGKPGTPELTRTQGSNPHQLLQGTITITQSGWACYSKDKRPIKFFYISTSLQNSVCLMLLCKVNQMQPDSPSPQTDLAIIRVRKI